MFEASYINNPITNGDVILCLTDIVFSSSHDFIIPPMDIIIFYVLYKDLIILLPSIILTIVLLVSVFFFVLSDSF